MKHFKIGFLSIIALLAMSFTIVSKDGIIKKTKLDTGTCDRNTDKLSGTYYLDNGQIGNGPCSGATAAISCTAVGLGKFVASSTTYTATSRDCEGSTNVCCFE